VLRHYDHKTSELACQQRPLCGLLLMHVN